MQNMIIKWAKDRFLERTTWDGATLIGTGLVVLIGTPLAKYAAYVAIIYGIYTLVTEEKKKED